MGLGSGCPWGQFGVQVSLGLSMEGPSRIRMGPLGGQDFGATPLPPASLRQGEGGGWFVASQPCV